MKIIFKFKNKSLFKIQRSCRFGIKPVIIAWAGQIKNVVAVQFHPLYRIAEAANKASTNMRMRLDQCRDTADEPCEHSGTVRAEAS